MELEAALVARGFAAVTAGSLSAAWMALDDRRFEAALLDLRLPDGLSVDLARELAAQGCALALISGDCDEDIPADLASVKRFRKPVGTDKLLGWIEGQFAAPEGLRK
jgi:DNA-binding response OmpR family regulator